MTGHGLPCSVLARFLVAILLLALVSGCLSETPPPSPPADPSAPLPSSAAQEAQTDPTPPSPPAPSASFSLEILDRSEPSGGTPASISFRASATNVADEPITLWWPPCGLPFGMKLRNESTQEELVPYDGACQPPSATRACMEPCETVLPDDSWRRAGSRELAPKETFSAVYVFQGWVQEYDDQGPRTWVPPGAYALVAWAAWYGDQPGIEAQAPFTWTEADADATDARR